MFVGNPTSESKTLTLPTETGTLLTEISAVSTAITGVGTLESLTVSGASTLEGDVVVKGTLTNLITERVRDASSNTEGKSPTANKGSCSDRFPT